MAILGWILWFGALALTAGNWLYFVNRASRDDSILWHDVARVLFLTLLTSWFFIIPEWNKLHLLWLIPLGIGVTAFFRLTRDAIP